MLADTMISEICNAITLADAATKIAKGVPKYKYQFNRFFRPPLKIAVLGESGNGKSCFLSVLTGKNYTGESTRYNQIVKYILPNGRRVHFIDCPGQKLYHGQRLDVKRDILNGKYHAIINVVCYGYNESEGTAISIFKSGTDEIKDNYLSNNIKFELDRLTEWVPDIKAQSKVKWVLTLINKADVWFDSAETEKKIINYYTAGAYYDVLKQLLGFCELHVLPYCSTISPFGGKSMLLHISETDKKKLHLNVIKNITDFISHVRK